MTAVRPFKQFSPSEDRIWGLLWQRQIENCQKYACRLWLDGLHKLDMTPDRIPDFARMSERLQELVGWELVSTDVIFSDGQTWFEHLARRQFLITEYIRDEKDLLYTPLPDIWHDAFGHLPLMTDRRYADYVQHFAHVALRYTPEERKSLGSLWWYTIEFGFMIEDGQMKAFGAGLMSSPGELEHAYSDAVTKTPFSIEAFERISPSPHAMHNTLFILDDMAQLEASAEQWAALHPQAQGI
jgi:phenylalanine-4-hydroxylase